MPAVLYAIQILNSIIPLIPVATDLFARIQQQRNSLEQMAAEKRDPTPEEWAALDSNINALRSQLHAK